MRIVLLASVFVIATCGLVYELIAGTLASYVLGDSVTQFSTVIGVYLFSMGIGSWTTKFITRNLVTVFVRIEILVGFVGGISAALLFLLFEHVDSFRICLYSIVSLIGVLVGVEIPLLMRILQGQYEFKDLVSKVFTFDCVGALLASLLFPLVLVPRLGLVRSAFMFGIFNVVVALWTLQIFKQDVQWVRLMRTTALFVLAVLTLGFIGSDHIMSFAESSSYRDNVIFAQSSKYQRIVLTKQSDELRLFLNGNLQFSSRDEYRYHEALVHVGMAGIHRPKRVLVLGGGDGLAVREILKYPAVEQVTLVDLDPEVTRLFSRHEFLVELNQGALKDAKVKVINADAFIWLKENSDKFDFIAVDFPDPGNYSLGKLYSTTLFALLKSALNPTGAIVVQSTSPYVARRSFWCVDETLRAVGFSTEPFHAHVPSFGEWGFILAHHGAWRQPEAFPEGLRFIGASMLSGLFEFPDDMARVETGVNRLNNQVLVHYFEKEWAEYVQ